MAGISGRVRSSRRKRAAHAAAEFASHRSPGGARRDLGCRDLDRLAGVLTSGERSNLHAISLRTVSCRFCRFCRQRITTEIIPFGSTPDFSAICFTALSTSSINFPSPFLRRRICFRDCFPKSTKCLLSSVSLINWSYKVSYPCSSSKLPEIALLRQ